MKKIPLYNQNNDPLPDGQQDPQHSNDCGEECASMLGAAYRPNLVLPAGQLRMLLRGNNWQGNALTDGDDIVWILKNVFNIPSHTRRVDFTTSKIEITHALQSNMPVVYLGKWDGDYLHWIIPFELTPNNDYPKSGLGFVSNDPWGGWLHQIDWDTAASLYGGQYVHVDEVLN